MRWLGCGLMLMSLGCGSATQGPQRYTLSGKVTFNGQPVPKGFVTLEPDSEAGNSGPGGGASIVAGRYETPIEKGVMGGKYRVKIVGYDGVSASQSGEELPDGQPLFSPYETTLDLPQQNSTRDFDIPQPSSK